MTDQKARDEWTRLYELMLRWEIRRFQIASVAMVAMGAASLLLAIYVIFSPTTKLQWEVIALLGATAVCFGLPLLRKVDVKKDGAGFETTSPIEQLKSFIVSQQAAAEAASAEIFRQTRQQVGALATELEESARPAGASDANKAEKKGMQTGEPTLREIRKLLPRVTDDKDQQKGRFGDDRTATRRLTARTEPSAANKNWLIVTLRVESTDGKPLEGKYVYFFLHETFQPDVYRVETDKSGLSAELEISCYGAFTAGAVADRGQTKLEIDLATNTGFYAPQWWRNR